MNTGIPYEKFVQRIQQTIIHAHSIMDYANQKLEHNTFHMPHAIRSRNQADVNRK